MHNRPGIGLELARADRNAHPLSTVLIVDDLLPTGEAARRLGVNRRTLQHWARTGQVQPDYTTPGGHYRWDVDRLRRDLRDSPPDPDARS